MIVSTIIDSLDLCLLLLAHFQGHTQCWGKMVHRDALARIITACRHKSTDSMGRHLCFPSHIYQCRGGVPHVQHHTAVLVLPEAAPHPKKALQQPLCSASRRCISLYFDSRAL